MDDSLIDQLAPPQRLAVQYARSRNRGPTIALLTLDQRMASILQSRREPIIAQVRLAWWRDILSSTAREWPAGEPVLEALRMWRDPAGLEQLANGWEALLGENLTDEAIAEFTRGRGAAIACLAHELGERDDAAARSAGEIWALADLAANVSSAEEKARVVRIAKGPEVPLLPVSLRPIAVLAGLGAAALRKGGAPLLDGPGSVFRALRIGLIGR